MRDRLYATSRLLLHFGAASSAHTIVNLVGQPLIETIHLEVGLDLFELKDDLYTFYEGE